MAEYPTPQSFLATPQILDMVVPGEQVNPQISHTCHQNQPETVWAIHLAYTAQDGGVGQKEGQTESMWKLGIQAGEGPRNQEGGEDSTGGTRFNGLLGTHLHALGAGQQHAESL